MIRKCTDEDISDEELEKVINPFYNNYHEYIITYVMPLNLGSDFKPTTYLKGTIEYENFRIIGSVVQVKRYYD
mgnify:CR=1 FL=1